LESNRKDGALGLLSAEPDSGEAAQVPYRWKAAIVSAAVFAFLCKILLAWNTFGSNDNYTFERFSFWSRLLGAGAYRANNDFQHPPSMIHLLRLFGWLTDTTGIFFPFWMRLPAIFADAASVWLLWRILAPQLHKSSVRWAMLLVALSPILILTTGFHGNSDAEMIFFVLLSVWLTDTGAGDWAAGAALGAAMSVKILPLILIPVMFFHRNGYRRRIVFLCSLGAAIIVAWSPYVFEDPGYILHKVIGYRSSYGDWGLAWLFVLAAKHSPKWQSLNGFFQSFGAYPVLAVVGALSFWISRPVPNRNSATAPLFSKVGAVLFVFMALASGFGVQYLAWLVPWTAGLGLAPTALFLGTGGVFLFVTYNYWAGPIPWYLADVEYQRRFWGHLGYPGLVCWFSVLLLAWLAIRQVTHRQTDGEDARRTAPALPVVFAYLLTVPILAYPVARVLIDVRHQTAPDRVALTTLRGPEYVDLALRLESVGKSPGDVGRAGEALRLHPALRNASIDIPDYTLASWWNTLAGGYAERGMWDESIAAAGESLRVYPDAQARDTLARALGQKRLHAGAAK
jgi:hypothetical protein